MPRQKPWVNRIVQIIEALHASEVDSFKRRDVEQMFGVARSAATELMTIAGMVRRRDGTEAFVTKENLLFYLRNSPDGQNAMTELARRKRLGQTLQKASEEARLRAIHLPVTSADEWTRFVDLPNVSVQPGVLTVLFSSPEDLFGQLYRFAKAAGGEWDAFLKMCEPPSTSAESADAAAPETPMAAAEQATCRRCGRVGYTGLCVECSKVAAEATFAREGESDG
jgi:hypothetical protein